MAALDFPAAPINGQVFTGVGGVNWVWDGAKWNPGNSTSGGQFLPLAGGTMTGPIAALAGGQPSPGVVFGASGSGVYGTSGLLGLLVNGQTRLSMDATTITAGIPISLPGPPTAAAHATTKAYVDGVSTNNVGRNLIHNPLFNIIQRGFGPFTLNGAFSADRWAQWYVNSPITTVINGIGVAPIPGSAVGDDAMVRVLYSTFTGGAAAGDLAILQHTIEGVQRLSGKTVTLSFWAATNGANLKIGASLDQNFGTGGTPSAEVSGTGQSITANSTYTRYSMTFVMPSVAGKNLGASGSVPTGNDHTKLNFWLSAGSNLAVRSGSVGVQSGGIAFWGVQLEIGSTMTPLEKPDPQQDWDNCLRFFQVGSLGLSAYGLAGNMVQTISQLNAPMRAAPTYTLSGQSTGNVTGIAVGPWGPSQNSAVCNGTVTTTGTFALYTDYKASADL